MIEKPLDDLVDESTGDSLMAVEYLLPIANLSYPEQNVDSFSYDGTNTRKTTHIRFVFKVKDDNVIVDYSYKTEGEHAKSFYDIINGRDSIAEILRETAEIDKGLHDKGILSTRRKIQIVLSEANFLVRLFIFVFAPFRLNTYLNTIIIEHCKLYWSFTNRKEHMCTGG